MKTLNLKHAYYRSLLMVCFLLINSIFLFAQRENYDDVLYSPSKEKKSSYQEPKRYVDSSVHLQSTESRETIERSEPDGAAKSSLRTDDDGNTYVTNNYYGSYTNYSEDDYYDYAYAARLKRFYGTNCGWSYYNDYYTNAYWYTYDPNYWGVSIYLGYSWWYPSWYYYSPYYYAGWGWGWGYYGYPWYGGGAYWAGYNYGYWNGYYAANCYYNSYDWNSCYYGRPVYYGSRTAGSRGAATESRSGGNLGARSSMASNATRSNEYMRSPSSRNASSSLTRDSRTFGERYEARAGNTNNSRVTTPTGRNDYNRAANSNSIDRNTNQIRNEAVNNGRTYDKPASNSPSFQRRGGVDINPNAATMNRDRGAGDRTYNNTPSPSSSREVYRKPASEQTRATERTTIPTTNSSGSSMNRERGSYSTPSREQNRYTSPATNTPSRSDNNRQTENNNPRYNTPTRTSAPSSTPSVSPSRSPSPATPSSAPRGGSSSGGSSSGGGRSSGGRR